MTTIGSPTEYGKYRSASAQLPSLKNGLGSPFLAVDVEDCLTRPVG